MADRKSVRYSIPAQEKEACPDGQEEKPSCRTTLDRLRQIRESTMIGALSTMAPSPDTAYWLMRLTSGLHRARKSGLGLPTRSFRPSVTANAPASDKPRPIHPVFHSQILRRHFNACEAPSAAAFSGTKTMLTAKIMTPGATSETTSSTGTVTVLGLFG